MLLFNIAVVRGESSPKSLELNRKIAEMTSLQQVVESRIDIAVKSKLIDELYDHWILGRGAEVKQPRWSIIRDVLHWVK